MFIREAQLQDIPHLQEIRNKVKENVLSNPNLVTGKEYEIHFVEKGKGWVAIVNDEIVGFSIINLKDNTVWALFLAPQFERQGIGKQLHEIMLNWYFKQTKQTVWLSTSPNTRAEIFYKKAGWVEVGEIGKGEIKFEMHFTTWLNIG